MTGYVAKSVLLVSLILIFLFFIFVSDRETNLEASYSTFELFETSWKQ